MTIRFARKHHTPRWGTRDLVPLSCDSEVLFRHLEPNFSRALLAVRRPSVAAIQVFGPGYTTPVAGPGLKPSGSARLLPSEQSCAAWRKNGISFAKPLMLAAIERIRSVALAPAPPQSSHALR